MKTYKSSEIRKFDTRPGLIGTIAHGEGVTLAHWVFDKDAPLAPHSHRHEQIAYVMSGKVRFETESGEARVVEAGDFAVFAPNEVHGGIALENTVVLDAFSPAREDFKEQMGWKD
jgi:quercetin dioxygenase-like cupin family protein